MFNFYRAHIIVGCIPENENVDLDYFFDSWRDWIPLDLQRSSKVFLGAEDAYNSLYIWPGSIGMVIKYSFSCQSLKDWIIMKKETGYSSIEFFRTFNGIDLVSLGIKNFNPER